MSLFDLFAKRRHRQPVTGFCLALIGASLLASLSACNRTPTAPTTPSAQEWEIEGGWARPSQGTMGAVYFTLTNHSNSEDRLIEIQSPNAEAAEIHQTIEENGIMRMRPMGEITLAPEERLQMAPRGTHLMLIGLKGPLQPGKTVQLTLIFEQSPPVEITIPVKNAP